MNTNKKTKALMALLLAVVSLYGCTAASGSENYQAEEVETILSPDGTEKKTEKNVKKETKNSKTEVEKPVWLVELVNSVFKFFV